MKFAKKEWTTLKGTVVVGPGRIEKLKLLSASLVPRLHLDGFEVVDDSGPNSTVRFTIEFAEYGKCEGDVRRLIDDGLRRVSSSAPVDLDGLSVEKDPARVIYYGSDDEARAQKTHGRDWFTPDEVRALRAGTAVDVPSADPDSGTADALPLYWRIRVTAATELAGLLGKLLEGGTISDEDKDVVPLLIRSATQGAPLPARRVAAT